MNHRETMGVARCRRCQDDRLETGTLTAQHEVRFRPDRKRTFAVRGVPLKATMCRACGHLEIEGDTERLAGMLKE
jgi:ribosomal protein L40E